MLIRGGPRGNKGGSSRGKNRFKGESNSDIRATQPIPKQCQPSLFQ